MPFQPLRHQRTTSNASSATATTPQHKPIRVISGGEKSQPIVGVSPPQDYHQFDQQYNKMLTQNVVNGNGPSPIFGNTMTETEYQSWSGRQRGDSSSAGSSPDASELQAPSLTTGSTSASVESLESVQDQHQRRLMHAIMDEKVKAQKALAASNGKVHAVGVTGKPPTSFDSSADGTSLVHSEFAYCANQAYRYTSQHPPGAPLPDPIEEEPSYFILLTTYVSYLILIVIGHCRDFVGKRLFPKSYRHLMAHGGYAALNSDFDSFYTRRLKARLDDCFSRPVTGVCGRTVMTLDRSTDDFFRSFYFTGEKTRALNVSAYNYLGYAQSHGGCADAVLESLKLYGVSSYGSRLGAGSLDLQQQTEKLVAQFVGQEDAIVVSMGFATNSTTIPAISGPGTLLISDELNHASIRFGARLSGAHIRSFKHNDMHNLEKILRESISQGMPRTHRPWKKIVILVEGLYSMEGTLVNLPKLIELKKKYKFYIYLDEAHSIGAIGPRGRGVCDYYGIDPKSVDILMGTFTKSFGAAGGYICASKALIDRIRLTNHANVYGETLAPPILTQIIASMAGIMGVGRNVQEHALLPPWFDLPPRMLDGSEGRERLRRLAFNARYLSSGLRKLGFIVYGHRDSPIVPLMIFQPGKMALFSRMMLDRQSSLPPSKRFAAEQDEETFQRQQQEDNRFLSDPTASSKGGRPPIVVVVVAYPATPLISSRVRFCISSAHNIGDMQAVLRATDEVGSVLNMKYGSGGAGGKWNIDEVLARPLDLVSWDGTTPLPPKM